MFPFCPSVHCTKLRFREYVLWKFLLYYPVSLSSFSVVSSSPNRHNSQVLENLNFFSLLLRSSLHHYKLHHYIATRKTYDQGPFLHILRMLKGTLHKEDNNINIFKLWFLTFCLRFFKLYFNF